MRINLNVLMLIFKLGSTLKIANEYLQHTRVEGTFITPCLDKHSNISCFLYKNTTLRQIA